jgi:hypothetical protein
LEPLEWQFSSLVIILLLLGSTESILFLSNKCFSALVPFIIYICRTAFGGGSDNPHLPHNHEMDQVVYTGTHDNDTVSSKFLYCFAFKYFWRTLIKQINIESLHISMISLIGSWLVENFTRGREANCQYHQFLLN